MGFLEIKYNDVIMNSFLIWFLRFPQVIIKMMPLVRKLAG